MKRCRRLLAIILIAFALAAGFVAALIYLLGEIITIPALIGGIIGVGIFAAGCAGARKLWRN
jgi:hypothetical protein